MDEARTYFICRSQGSEIEDRGRLEEDPHPKFQVWFYEVSMGSSDIFLRKALVSSFHIGERH